MNSLALQHQILNCFACGVSLTSSEVYSQIRPPLLGFVDARNITTKHKVQKAMLDLYNEGRISRRQPTKKAAFIYHVALANVEPKPSVFVTEPMPISTEYNTRPFKFWATITMAPLFFGLVSGLMWS